MAEPGAKLRIEQPTISPHSTRVWLNDQDITSCLQGIALQWKADDVTTATIAISVRELEIGAQTIVNMLAALRDPSALEQAIHTLEQAKARLCPS